MHSSCEKYTDRALCRAWQASSRRNWTWAGLKREFMGYCYARRPCWVPLAKGHGGCGLFMSHIVYLQRGKKHLARNQHCHEQQICLHGSEVQEPEQDHYRNLIQRLEQKSLDWVEQIFQKQLWGQSTFKFMTLSDVQWGEECSTDLNQFLKWLRQNLRYMQLLTGLDLDVQCDCCFA